MAKIISINNKKLTLDTEINSFVSNYGIDNLITYLKKYENTQDSIDYVLYMKIIRSVCIAFNKTIEDVTAKKSRADQFPKKIIIYLSSRYTKYDNKELSDKLDITPRMVQIHLSDVVYYLEHERNFKEQVEKIRECEMILNKPKTIIKEKTL